MSDGRKIDLVAISRVTSHALRHEPWLYELELDDEGWTPTERLVEALRLERPYWHELTVDHLRQMIEQSTKRRYEISGDRIRALYGHSIEGKLKKKHAVPPTILFHGTNPSVAPMILTEGLRPMSRQYVHLSTDTAMAREVGRRKCRQPVILQINAGEAAEQGICFYEGNERVWLADVIPSQFIVLPAIG